MAGAMRTQEGERSPCEGQSAEQWCGDGGQAGSEACSVSAWEACPFPTTKKTTRHSLPWRLGLVWKPAEPVAHRQLQSSNLGGSGTSVNSLLPVGL